MRRHRLVLFFLILFALSWGVPGLLLALSWSATGFDVSLDRYSPLYYLFFWAPAISALCVVALTEGGAALCAFVRRTVRPRFRWRWWTAVILGVPLLKLLAWALAEDAGPPAILDTTLPWGSMLMAALLMATSGPMGEVGWRGFALPLLQRRLNGLVAALVIGTIWSLWYMPWLLPGTVMNWSLGGDSIPAMVRFLAGGLALSITATVIFNGSGGSVPLMYLFHWLNGYPHMWEMGTHVAYVDTVIALTTAGVLVFVLRRRYLSRHNRCTEIAPGVMEGN